MTPADFLTRVLIPAEGAFPFHATPASRALLLAIAGQESGWTSRVQDNDGPGHSFWQFEHGNPESRGGVTGLVLHPVAAPILRQFCADWEILFDIGEIYEAIVFCAPLAYCCARLLLWTDPAPLPAVGDYINGCAVYERLWRPGKPDRSRWATRYTEALAVVSGAAVA